MPSLLLESSTASGNNLRSVTKSMNTWLPRQGKQLQTPGTTSLTAPINLRQPTASTRSKHWCASVSLSKGRHKRRHTMPLCSEWDYTSRVTWSTRHSMMPIPMLYSSFKRPSAKLYTSKLSRAIRHQSNSSSTTKSSAKSASRSST